MWDGNEYVVTWTERLNGAWHVRGIRLDRTGDAIDSAPFDISGAGGIGGSLSLTAGGVVIAYSRIEGGETHAYMRILERLPSLPKRASARH